jgi:HD-GYP domain-containing protein (c-di-GMP phosphodiesterase class II)
MVGVSILEPIKELEDCVQGIKYHHERYDGAGYPEGLKGDQIPLTASIISVADAFDAMITDRPYRKGLSKQEAIDTITRERGKQFDPFIIDVLLDLYRTQKI